MKEQLISFKKAIPVWEKEKENSMNHTVEFRTVLQDKNDYVLRLAGASSYIVFVNENFVLHGPARAAHGFYKVDEICLKQWLTEGENHIYIRCNGYNVNSFSYLDQSSFLCAEIYLNEEVVCATGTNLLAFSVPSKIKKTQRYSYQRTFAESYRLNEEMGEEVNVAPVGERKFIKRDVPYVEYTKIYPDVLLQEGTLSISDKLDYYNGREITGISEDYKGFRLEELEYASHIEYGKLDFAIPTIRKIKTDMLYLAPDTYADFSMGKNHTGLFAMNFEVKDAGTIFLAYDELLEEGKLDPFRNHCSSIIAIQVEEGNYRFVSAEPYTAQYVRLVAKDTAVIIREFYMYEIAFPEKHIQSKYVGNDKTMKLIYEAAKESFRANVVDIYMDCPQRERAGWLCDSFFTARVEKLLTGQSVVEKSFLQSFLLPERFEGLEEGMLPMCYPADVILGEFIPNWTLWYGLELYEYYERTQDAGFIEFAKPCMEKILLYFRKFENDMGLLEGLKGCVFVDASDSNYYANKYSISFPTNMLYAAFLSVMGLLYDKKELVTEARQLRKLIRKLALTEKGFWCDGAERTEEGICVGTECTETCQYYAYFFHITTPQETPELWKCLLEEFGYDRKDTGKYEEIAPANAFIGNYLRLELLAKFGCEKELYDNICGYFSYMAEKTGTLWEYVSATASCNHGYASYVIFWMAQLGFVE